MNNPNDIPLISAADLVDSAGDFADNYVLISTPRLGVRRLKLSTLIQSVKHMPQGVLPVTYIGDSITNNNYVEFAPGQFGFAAYGVHATASMALKGRLRMVNDLGVSGDTTKMVLARLQTAIDDASQIIVWLSGTNDITNDSTSAESVINDIVMAAKRVTRAGKLFVVCTIPPKDSTTDLSVRTRATKHAEINFNIAYRIGAMPGVLIADYYSTVIDVATNTWVSGYSTDGTHPLHNATFRMGLCLADALAPLTEGSYRAHTQPGHINNAFNLVYNPYLNGDNAAGTNGWTVNTGVTGTGPHGWNAGRLVGTPTATTQKITESSATATQMRRQWLEITTSYAADSDCVVGRYDINQTSTYTTGAKSVGQIVRPTVPNGYAYRVVSIPAGTASAEPVWPTTPGLLVTDGTVTWQCIPLIQAGLRAVGVMEYNISANSGNVSPMVQCSCRNASNIVLADMTGNRRATLDALCDSFVANGVIWTPEFIIPENTVRIQLNAGLYGSAGGSSTFAITGGGVYILSDTNKLGAYA